MGHGGSGSLRIIGGSWRGRKLPVPNVPGLRPTADRVRETLFNWLMPDVVGARCLDLFAGAGALGLEALSRGAAHCDFVELDKRAAVSLNQSLALLDATQRAAVINGSAEDYLSQTFSAPFDLVFLDPPFASDLLEQALTDLGSSSTLAAHALIYFEHARGSQLLPPDGWDVRRSKTAGDVVFGLLERD